MKLIILRNNLLEGLVHIERAVGSNVNLPILKNVLIKTDDGKIVMTTTNLELAIKSIVSGKVIENGEVTVPFSILSSIVKNLVSERITLEKKDKQLVVSTDNYEALIQGQDTKEFPIIPSIHNKDQSIKISSQAFVEALGSVVVATQFSDIRPEISGVFMVYSEKQLVLAATDGFRLGEKRVSSSQVQSSFDEVSAIIPLRTAEEVLRIFSSEEGEVSLFVDQNQILFKNPNRELISRLVDGQFPDYKAIIPKQVQNEVHVNRQEIINAVKLISSFSGRGNDITVKLGDNKKYLELYSATSALGENRYRVPIKFKGDDFSVMFNWHYLLDGLKIYKSDEVVLGVSSSDRPTTIKSESDQSLIYILMPIKA